jgi:putative transposase
MALQVMPDHAHFFVSAPPKWDPARIVQSLKAWTSKDLREKFAIIKKTRFSDDFWASSYYCETAGHVSAEVVAKYIRENFKRYY